MGEFDENFEDETVDTSSEGSYDTSDSDDFDESSSDSFDEDVSNAEYEERQAEAEAEANAEYAEQQAEAEAEANAEYAEQQAEAEAEANAEYAEQQAEAEAKANAEYAEQQAEAEAKANAEYEEDQIDESELSPAELYELGQQEAKEAQDKAERWADENNLDSWYDGTPRANYHEDVEDSPEMAMDANADQQEEAQSQKEYEEQQAEAERQQEYKEQQAEAGAVTWDLESFDEDTESADDESMDSSVLVDKYKDLDNQYKAAKSDIDFSKTEEEQSFWTKRADQLHQEREDIEYKIYKNK